MNKKIIIIVVAVLLVLTLGIGVFIFLNMNKSDEPKEKKITYFEYAIKDQYANIKIPEGERKSILKYSFAIKYTDDALTPEFDQKSSELKSEFRRYFMSKTQLQLTKMDRVQEDLLEITIGIMNADNEKITNVFLTDFIIN